MASDREGKAEGCCTGCEMVKSDLRRRLAKSEEERRASASKASSSARQALLADSELRLYREKLVWSEKRVLELERLLFARDGALPERPPAPTKAT